MAKINFIVARDPLAAPAGLVNAVVAIGNFDGLHRGHRGVIARAQILAKKLNKPCALLTFEPHPADVFAEKNVILRKCDNCYLPALLSSYLLRFSFCFMQSPRSNPAFFCCFLPASFFMVGGIGGFSH